MHTYTDFKLKPLMICCEGGGTWVHTGLGGVNSFAVNLILRLLSNTTMGRVLNTSPLIISQSHGSNLPAHSLITSTLVLWAVMLRLLVRGWKNLKRRRHFSS